MGLRSSLKGMIVAVAVLTGMFFAFVWRSYEMAVIEKPYSLRTRSLSHEAVKSLPVLGDTDYKSWLRGSGMRRRAVSEEFVSFGGHANSSVQFESEFLRKQVPVLCLVLSKGRGKAKAVSDTWGRHCNNITFHAHYVDQKIPVNRYSSLEPSHVSFCKIMLRISQVMDLKAFKWLLVAEDSAFVVLENVRKLVAPLDHNAFYYLGRPVQKYALPPHNALDSTIVLSQGSVQFLMSQHFTNFSSCEKHEVLLPHPRKTGPEEAITLSRNFESSVAQILQTHNNTSPCDTRDGRGRAKFMAFSPEKYLIRNAISIFSSFWRQNIFHSPHGFDCCSPDAISFNGISPSKMYLTDYLLYHTSVFKNSPRGIGNNPVIRGVRSQDQRISEALRSVEIGAGSIQMLQKSNELASTRSLLDHILDAFRTF